MKPEGVPETIMLEPVMAPNERRTTGAKSLWLHPVSCVVLMGCDFLWTTVEWAAFLWLITIPVTFTLTALPVYLVQKNLQDDSRMQACSEAVVCGVLAAIPTPIMGTAVGAAFLAMTGIKKYLR